MLTKRQIECLVFIHEYMVQNIVCPSYDEIRIGLGLSSKSNVHRLVNGLLSRGFLGHKYGRVRGLEIIKLPKGWEVYAHKVDDNQKEIIAAFRKLGYSVKDTSRLGSGFPDICCGKAGRTYIFEIKDGKKPPSARKLTKAEQDFKDGWLGQYRIIESVEDVLAFDRSVK